eukprot:5278107-Pyramimonas_sp.AAC.1
MPEAAWQVFCDLLRGRLPSPRAPSFALRAAREREMRITPRSRAASQGRGGGRGGLGAEPRSAQTL